MTLCVVRDGARMIHFRVFKRLVSGHSKYLNLHLVNNKTAFIKHVSIYETMKSLTIPILRFPFTGCQGVKHNDVARWLDSGE
jgi:hypothetical protein